MKLWKGRFSKAATSSADEFNASIEFDQRLYKEDITGSIAHAKMLAKQGIIPQEDADLIVKTLKEILPQAEEEPEKSAEGASAEGDGMPRLGNGTPLAWGMDNSARGVGVPA